jgi:hypothetical protein
MKTKKERRGGTRQGSGAKPKVIIKTIKNKTMKTLGRIFYYAQRVTLVAFPAYFTYRILLYCYAGI